MEYIPTLEFAKEMDHKDPLAKYRNKFIIPRTSMNPDFIYFAGLSLGAAPKKAREYVNEEFDKWENDGVYGHFSEPNPWLTYADLVKEPLANILGAEPSEIVAMDTLTSNLHFLLISFYSMGERNKILIENDPFPSDIDVVTSQIDIRTRYISEYLKRDNAYDTSINLFMDSVQGHVVQLQSDPTKLTLSTEYICDTITEHKDELSLVFLPGVHYLTGQAFDLKTITETAHKYGITAGFDLAHWAGNIESHLHGWNVDFAAWCNYKYLNSGPGSIGGLFVHEKYHDKLDTIPRSKGWFGRTLSTRFDMGPEHYAIQNAEAWRLSNPNIFSLASLRASLDIFEEATMDAVRQKSVLLTGYLEYLLTENIPDLEIITPPNPAQRGAMLSLRIKGGKAKGLEEKLKKNGAAVDFRKPDIMRVAPNPLYNNFEEVYRFVDILKSTLND